MTNKEQIFKMIEEKTDTMQTLTLECIELIYNAGYNEGIEHAALVVQNSSHIAEGLDTAIAEEIRGLKK